MTNDSPTISSFKPMSFHGKGGDVLTIKGKTFSSSAISLSVSGNVCSIIKEST